MGGVLDHEEISGLSQPVPGGDVGAANGTEAAVREAGFGCVAPTTASIAANFGKHNDFCPGRNHARQACVVGSTGVCSAEVGVLHFFL